MKKLKEKKLLLAKIGCIAFVIAIVITACGDEGNSIKPPKWEAPQPIDSLLLGSWNFNDYITISFYENNECVIKYNGASYYGNDYEEARNWYVNKDTLILPGSYDVRVMRFPAYQYDLKDNNLLYLTFINYPFVGKGPFTMQGPLAPLGTGLSHSPILEYKRLEDE